MDGWPESCSLNRMSASPSRRDALRALAGLLAVGALPRPSLTLKRRGPLARSSDRPYLAQAQLAANWLAGVARSSAIGTSWHWDPADPKPEVQTNLYSGTAGIVLFFVELHAATGDVAHRELALSGADYLASTLPAAVKGDDAGLYTGLAGVAWTLAFVGRALASERHLAAANGAFITLANATTPVGTGLVWNESHDIIAGSSGIGLVMLDRHRTDGDGRALSHAVRAGQRLLEVAVPATPGGLTWDLSPSVPRRYPNFSHGAAGVGYFLAQLFRRTNDRRFLEGSLGAARYLEAIAERTAGDGRRIFHHTPGGESLFYLSWCHGPAGTARLHQALAAATGDAQPRRMVEQLAQATIDSRVPERSDGYWNNISCCCGNCGVSDFYVAMHAESRDPRFLAHAEAMARDTAARGTPSLEGARWVQAENRSGPTDLRAQTGLMQGAAGVGLSMLRLDAALNGRKRVVVLPDDPWAG